MTPGSSDGAASDAGSRAPAGRSPAARPIVVAHRGSSAAIPEHTVAAYKYAITEGADALECDVRLTRDGHLVCMHDRRVERTSNGRGVVSEFSLRELNDLDFGSWHPGLPDSADDLVLDQHGLDLHSRDQAGPDRSVRDGFTDVPIIDDERNRVLTFATLLDIVTSASRPVKLLVETKHPTRYGGLVERMLVSELRRFGLATTARAADAGVTVMSFSSLAVRRIRELAPDVPTVLLMDAVPRLYRDGSLPFGAHIAGPGIGIVQAHPGYVARAHARGHPVYVWTVNSTADLDLVLSLGVDGIITDVPTLAITRLAHGRLGV